MKEKEKTKEEILSKFRKNEKGQYVHTLIEPIKHGETLIKELELNTPKAKHIRKVGSSTAMDDTLKVIGSLSCQPDSVIDELCLEDVNILGDYFTAFG